VGHRAAGSYYSIQQNLLSGQEGCLKFEGHIEKAEFPSIFHWIVKIFKCTLFLASGHLPYHLSLFIHSSLYIYSCTKYSHTVYLYTYVCVVYGVHFGESTIIQNTKKVQIFDRTIF
jgi:hypothetical protein